MARKRDRRKKPVIFIPGSNPNHPTKKLGKMPHVHDTRTLRLAKYLTPTLPPPPLEMGYVNKVQDWGMMINDQLGDCVIATAGHIEEQWCTYTGRKFDITDNDILKTYEKVGGYMPGDPSTDNGADILSMLKFWRNVGIAGHKIGAFVQVDPTNRKEVSQAISLFGNVFIGLQLPLTAQLDGSAPQVWQMDSNQLNGPGQPGSWGGHAVPLVGYSNAYRSKGGTPGVLAVTWGSLMSVTWPFLMNYCDEMFAVIGADWFTAAGKAPNGFNIKQLSTDLTTLGNTK